jgi:hypothetical protein
MSRSDGAGASSALMGSSRDSLKRVNDQSRRSSTYRHTFRGSTVSYAACLPQCALVTLPRWQNNRMALPTGSPMEVFGSSEHRCVLLPRWLAGILTVLETGKRGGGGVPSKVMVSSQATEQVPQTLQHVLWLREIGLLLVVFCACVCRV